MTEYANLLHILILVVFFFLVLIFFFLIIATAAPGVFVLVFLIVFWLNRT